MTKFQGFDGKKLSRQTRGRRWSTRRFPGGPQRHVIHPVPTAETSLDDSAVLVVVRLVCRLTK